jgi:hypothetical protein
MSQIEVLVGTTAVRKSSFALGHFLRNLYDIQNAYSGSELVIATDEPDFVGELESLLREYRLKSRVVVYRTEKPDYAKNHRIWSMTFGREAIRRYARGTDASYLLSLDADMTYDSKIINILLDEIGEYDVVQSGYMMRSKAINALGFGLGCSLIKKEALDKIEFRCLEFKTGQIIEEGNAFEMDLVRRNLKIKKGIFLSINHYSSNREMIPINPGSLTRLQKITTYPLLRYLILQLSIMFRYDITRYLQIFVYRRR